MRISPVVIAVSTALTIFSTPAPLTSGPAHSVANVARVFPMTHKVDCETARPPGLRVIYGPGGGPTECFGGTGPESIARRVQGIATTSHSGVVLIQESGRCAAIPFGPNQFLRVEAVVCAINIDSE